MTDLKAWSAGVGLLCAVAAPAGAESLWDIYGLAQVNDPRLRGQAAELEATEQAIPQSRSFLLPNIQLNANTTKNTLRTDSGNPLFSGGKTEYNSNALSVTLVQPLFNYQVFAGLGIARSTVDQAIEEFDFAQTELMLRSADGYFNVLNARDALEFARAEKRAIERQLEQARQRFEVGLISITDIHEAQARYDLAVAQEIAAENQLTTALEVLRELTGIYPQMLNALRDPAPLQMPEPADMEHWVSTALASNPLIAAAEFATEAARDEISRQRAGHFPTLNAVGTYVNSSDNGSRFGSGGLDAEDTILSLEFNLPIFEGGLVQSRVRESQARYRQAQELLEQQRRAVVRQTRDAYLGVEAAISRVKALNAALVSNESALEATELGYEVGTRTSVDVLDAQRELYRAKRDLATSRYQYVLNLLSLQQAAGTLNEDDLERVNSWLSEQAESVVPADVVPNEDPETTGSAG